MTREEELKRKDELGRLESLHKEALAERVADYHRSTKTTIKKFQGVHLRLRENHLVYRAWHNFRFANLIHWFLLFSFLTIIGFNLSAIIGAIIEKNKTPDKHVVVFGHDYLGDAKGKIIAESNITINDKDNLELDDKNIDIGSLKINIDLGQLVSWKCVEWSTHLPEGTSIVYRVRSTKTDESDDWEAVPWSGYYPIKKSDSSFKGIPETKTRYLEVEITLQGNKGQSPELNYITFGYTPFEPNKIVVYLKDGLLNWIKNVFSFFQKKEGIYTD